MPFALTFIGLLLIVVGFQDTYKQFGTLVAGDFTGPGNFVYWLAALGIIGAIGYVKPFEGFSRAFMVLLILVMFLSNKGFFASIGNQLSSGTSQKDTVIGAALPAGGGGGGSGGSSGGFDIGNAVSIATTAAEFL